MGAVPSGAFEGDGLTLHPPASPVIQVARKLLDELTGGGLRAGTRLPSERSLADSLKVGRSAVREALAVLEVLGIVEIRMGSGTYVRGTISDLLPQAINWGLMLGERHVLDLVEVRQHMESITARLAAERASVEDVARLRDRLDQMLATAEAVPEFVEADVDFHLEVANIADNQVLQDILRSLRTLLRVWIQRAVGADGDTRNTLAEHIAVFDAIERRSGDDAASAMSFHMQSASARLRRTLTEES